MINTKVTSPNSYMPHANELTISEDFNFFLENLIDSKTKKIINDLIIFYANKKSNTEHLPYLAIIIDTFIFNFEQEQELNFEEEEYSIYSEAIKIKSQHSKLINESTRKIEQLFQNLNYNYPYYHKILTQIKKTTLKEIELNLNINNLAIQKIFSIQDDQENAEINTLFKKNGRPKSFAFDAFLVELREHEFKYFKARPFINLYKPVLQTIANCNPDLLDINDFNNWDKIRSRINYLEKNKTFNYFLRPEV